MKPPFYPIHPVKDTPSVKLVALDWKKVPWYKRWYKWATIRRQWRITEDYVVYSPIHDCNLVVPKIFLFDFASVPKLLSGFFNPAGILAEGSVPHDFGYRYGGFLLVQSDGSLKFVKARNRKEVDDTMEAVGVYCTGASAPYKTAKIVLKPFGGPNYNQETFRASKYQLWNIES